MALKMDTVKTNENSNLKDLYLHEISAKDETHIPNINISKNQSSMISCSQLSTDENLNLKDSANRRKTLIFAATTQDISNLEWNNHENNETETGYMEDGEPVGVGTQTEVSLLDCYRFSPLLNHNLETHCLEINSRNVESEGNSHQLLETICQKGTQIDAGLLDLYSLSPHFIDTHKKKFQQRKEEKQIEDDTQGLPGLALLVGSTNANSKGSPKTSPRNNSKPNTLESIEEEHIINHFELISHKSKLSLDLETSLTHQSKTNNPISRPTSRENSIIDQNHEWVVVTSNKSGKINNNIERKENGLQIEIDPQRLFSTNSIFNMQLNNNLSNFNNLVNDSSKDYCASKSLDSTWEPNINSTRLVSGKLESKKELKLKHKTPENLMYRNGYGNLVVSTSPKSPRKSSLPNFDYDKRCFCKDGEGMQEGGKSGMANEKNSKNEGDGLTLESHKRDCKEWFQKRLWGFLFENLSRAVDEVYFYCDLQGASEKMDEAILFLEEACEDFKELKSGAGLDKTSMIYPSVTMSEGETSKSDSETKGIKKAVQVPKLGKLNNGFQNDNIEEKVETVETVEDAEITELQTEKENLWCKSISDKHEIHDQEKQLAHLGSEEKMDIAANNNEKNKKNRDEFKPTTIEEGEGNDKSHETSLVTHTGGVDDAGTSEETFRIDKWVTESEVGINDKQPQTTIHEKIIDTHFDSEKNKPTMEPTMESTNGLGTTNLNGGGNVGGKDQKHFQSFLSWEVFNRSPHEESQFENRNTDCEVEVNVNVVESPVANESKINCKTMVSNGRNYLDLFKERNQESEFMISTQNRAASVIGYQVDEEQRKMVEFVENEPPKCKSNKRILQSPFTGRLMRPTHSSNIRASTNLKIKEKEKSNNKERYATWILSTKCQSNNLKQKTNWLNALATPRRGPSRCEDFEKTQSSQNLNIIDKESFMPQILSKRMQIGENHREEQKNKIIDVPKVCQDNFIVKLPNRKQERIGSRVNDEKTSKRKGAYIPKKTTKRSVHEFDICHVEDRLAKRLKEGANRRIACLDEIKNRVSFMSEGEIGDKYKETSKRSNFWKVDSFGNQISFYKSKECFDNVDNVSLQLKGITLFQKQAMKKKIRNIRLKLANQKFEYSEPPSGIEGIGIGSATATGLAKGKIGKWMEELRQLQFSKNATTINLVVLEIAKCFEGKQSELHVARQLGLLDYVATTILLRQDPTTTVGLLQIQNKLLYLPANRSYFIIRNLFPPLVPMLLSSLEIFTTFGNFDQESNSFSCNQETHEFNDDQIKRTKELSVLQEILEGLLNCTISIMEHSCIDKNQLSMQDDLVDLLVACGLIHQLQNIFSVFHWQQGNQTPIPNSIICSLKLIEALTGSKRKSLTAIHEEPINVLVQKSCLKQNQSNNRKEESTKESNFTFIPIDTDHSRDMINKPKEDVYKLSGGIPRIVISPKTSSLSESTIFLIATISETRIVGLLSLLIGMILPIDASSQKGAMKALPPNFNEVAIILLQVLNNVARLDLSLIQSKLALPDVCLEFYQLISFLLTYCTINWKSSNDEIAALLLETLMFLGYAALLHPEHQALLRLGKNPTIIQKMCNLPFIFFSDSKLTPILIGTLLAICYGSEINRDVVQQQLSMEILLNFFKSSKTGLFDSFNSTNLSKDKEEMKNQLEKATQNNVKNSKTKNEEAFDNQQSIQRLTLPKALFSPSKSMMAKEKLGLFAPSPSSPKGTRQGYMACCSTIQSPAIIPPHALCSRLSKRVDFNHGISSLIHGDLIDEVARKNAKSPRLPVKNSEVNQISIITMMDPLPRAFELQNRFPKGLWSYAEDFFSSSTWMGQLLKCL